MDSRQNWVGETYWFTTNPSVEGWVFKRYADTVVVCSNIEAETQADGATAPNMPAPTAPAPPAGTRWVWHGNDFIAKPVYVVDGIGRALDAIRRPSLPCDLATRFVGGARP